MAKRRRTKRRNAFDRIVRHMHGVNRVATTEAAALNYMLVNDIWPGVNEKVRSRLSRIRTRGGITQIRKQKNYRELRKSLTAELRAGFKRAENEIVSRMSQLAEIESRFTVTVMGEEFRFDLPQPDKRRFRQIVLNEPYAGGMTLGDRMTRLRQRAATGVIQAVDAGLMRGLSTDEILKEINGPRGPVRQAARNIETETRTLAEHTASAARSDIIEELPADAFVEEWTAVRDKLTCPECAALDGQRFPIGEGPFPPLHENCRCDRMPVEVGSPPNTDTYEDWLRDQPESVQDEVLGKTRADLWRTNQVKIENFSDSDWRPLSLDELARREGLSL